LRIANHYHLHSSVKNRSNPLSEVMKAVKSLKNRAEKYCGCKLFSSKLHSSSKLRALRLLATAVYMAA
jgi:hypothetical protein